MMKCRECGEKISKKATICPKCGAPNKKKSSIMSLLLIVIIGAFAFSFYSTETYSPPVEKTVSKPKVYEKGTTFEVTKTIPDAWLFDYRYDGKNAVRSVLKDPESAKFGKIYLVKYAESNSSWALCGYVNAKNSLGGYVGNKRFITLGTTRSTYLENDQDSNWVNAWNKYCDA